MILLGVGISIAVVVFVGFMVSKRIAGDSANFLVGGSMLPLMLVGGALMGSAVDTNATLGNTDLAGRIRLLGGRMPSARTGALPVLHGPVLRQADEPDGSDVVPGLLPPQVRPGRGESGLGDADRRVLHPGRGKPGRGRLPVQLLPRLAVLARHGCHRGSRGRLHGHRRPAGRCVHRDHPDEPRTGRRRRSADLDGRHARPRDRRRAWARSTSVR